MENKPLLYIDTISNYIEGDENKTIYDSRKISKKMAMHRLDDINAMLMYNLNIIIILKTKNELIEGIPKRVSDKYIDVLIKNELKRVLLCQIIDISIKKRI